MPATMRVMWGVLLCTVWGVLAHVPVLRAQELIVTASASSPDTLATIADLTGTTTTFRKAFTVRLERCRNQGGTTFCRVYMSARPKSGFGTLSNARWSASPDCSAATAVPIGTSPVSSGNTFILSVTASGSGRNGSRTLWFCYDAVLSWSTPPQSFVYELYFRRVRE